MDGFGDAVTPPASMTCSGPQVPLVPSTATRAPSEDRTYATVDPVEPVAMLGGPPVKAPTGVAPDQVFWEKEAMDSALSPSEEKATSIEPATKESDGALDALAAEPIDVKGVQVPEAQLAN
jgi:hypothetical protein